MNVTTVGIDLAKSVFSVHGVGVDGKVMLKRSVGRADLLPMFAQMPPCLIGMEACSGAQAGTIAIGIALKVLGTSMTPVSMDVRVAHTEKERHYHEPKT